MSLITTSVLFFQGIVKIELDVPANRLRTSKTIQNATTSSSKFNWTNSHLPEGYNKNKEWLQTFVPLLRDWVGTIQNPWESEKEDVKQVVQEFWDDTYPAIPHKVEAGEAVLGRARFLSSFSPGMYLSLGQAIQKMSEHRASIGTASFDGVVDRLSTIATKEERKEFVKSVLGKGKPFTYAKFNPKTKARLLVFY